MSAEKIMIMVARAVEHAEEWNQREQYMQLSSLIEDVEKPLHEIIISDDVLNLNNRKNACRGMSSI